LRIRKLIRNIDLACRYGGEEFVIVMPETDMAVATMVAERLRRRIVSEPFPIAKAAKSLEVTLSIGIGALNGVGDNAVAILKRADRALYRAKRDGRKPRGGGRGVKRKGRPRAPFGISACARLT
jgi:two-component system, cell cycle response regulator